MKPYKVDIVIDTLVKTGVVVVLVIGATTKQEYSYYTFLRWLVMTTSVYFAYKSFGKKQIGLLIYFVALIILFNPIQKVWFHKETWHLIDYLVAGFTTSTVVFDWLQNKKYDRV